MKYALIGLGLILSVGAGYYIAKKNLSSYTETQTVQPEVITLSPNLRAILNAQYPEIGSDVIDAYVTKVEDLNKEFGYSSTSIPPQEAGKIEVMEAYAQRLEEIKVELNIDKKLEKPTSTPAAYLPPPLISTPSAASDGAIHSLPTSTPPLKRIENTAQPPAAATLVPSGEAQETATPPLVSPKKNAPMQHAAPSLM